MPTASNDATKQHSNLSREEQADLETLNSTIDRMRALTAPDPYILTIPQDAEPRYHHTYQAQAMQWLHETPFRYHDGEMMQYQTFFYHEHGNGVYVLHSSRPKDEQGDGEKVRAVAVGTGANTPKDGAPKKTMSLNAYKKAKTGGSTPADAKQESAPAVKLSAVKGPIERVKAETEEVLAAVAEDDQAAPETQKKETKRKREDSVNAQDRLSVNIDQEQAPAAKRTRKASPPPPAKRAEAPPPQAQRAKSPEKLEIPPAPTEDEEETGLPPKLSPLEVASLPSRLSPTIPPNIAAALKAREQVRVSSSDSSAPNSASKNDKLTPIKKADSGITKHKSPIPRNAFRANSSSPAVRSDAEDKAVRPPVTSLPQPPQRAKTPELTRGEEIAVGKALKKKELVVRIKYKKYQREAIKRILNLRPKPGKAEAPVARATIDEVKPADVSTELKVKAASRERKDGPIKGVAQKIGPPPPSTNGVQQKKKPPDQDEKRESASRPAPAAEKRLPRPEDPSTPDTIAVKRKKVPEATETSKPREPSTPAPPDPPSPSMQLSTQKSQQVTPSGGTSTAKNHLLPVAVAMQRERSTDSNAFATDSPSGLSTSTPLTNGQHAPTSGNRTSLSTQTSNPSNRRPKNAAWEARQKRLETLGRELKHAASAHATAKESKLAAVKSLESLLAYILAFTCADAACIDPKQPSNSHAPDIRPWRSLLGFFGLVKRLCTPYPLLLGLASALGVVFNARILEIASQHPAEGPSRDTLLEAFVALHKAAVDAEQKLDIDALQAQVPKAWKAGRAKSSSEDEAKLTDPSQSFAGAFRLPLGVQTSQLRAARAGYAILEEWVEREKVGYQLKLQL